MPPEARRPELVNVPYHVAIIMDGNGRWARRRGLPRLAGHRAGMENIRRVIEGCTDFGVQMLTIYAFSTENWQRPPEEVQGLMRILEEVIDERTQEFYEKGVRLNHLGRLEGLAEALQRKVRYAVELTRENSKFVLNIAFNYGGRAEIVDAARRLLAEGVDAATLDEATFSRYLYTAGLPDPDLIIRTAGEMRLSNFLIWQTAYAEYYSTPTFWPDFDKQELYRALLAYSQRERRFGRV
ncbi:MAG: di-trans,poly-cis-decaprenylcistransferase [Chloroflexi bacterium]|nr:di-trans,poly-cis-decaprenylcistransferase [Chloroflexota bacterium]